MLKRLIIHQVALIDHLDIDFTDGFNVLTGETGAGKSIIIDAVNLAIGERASRDLIKHGAQKASVEAVFSISQKNRKLMNLLDEHGILAEEDDELVLSREITLSGKSICRINGILVNLAVQKSISSQLIDIHGQHEHQSLLSPANHLSILDDFSGESVSAPLSEVRLISRNLHKIEKQLNQGFINEAERERRIDILKYQIEEIERAKLEPGEEETLLEERGRLANAERIMLALETSFEELNGDYTSVLSGIKGASKQLEDISVFSSEYADLHTRLEDCYYTLEDIAYSLRNLRQSFEYDPARLEAVENRLSLISSLKRKYGSDIPEILKFCEQCAKELAALDSSVEIYQKLQAEISKLKSDYNSAAKKLTSARSKAAERLCDLAEAQLKDLGMQKAHFSVQFSASSESFGPNGFEDVEFLLSANAGEPLKPLNRVASGGEMSRIMLALKTIIAQIDHIDTLIFDEVDTGVSGRVAAIVGKKMLTIAASSQVICITHLPQIAAMADSHYMVKKEMTDIATQTTLCRLDMEERYREIARIMGAEESSRLALEHAKELVNQAEAEKLMSFTCSPNS